MEFTAEPLLPPLIPTQHSPPPASKPLLQSPWVTLAAASGACAAINGVFAKLTTTELTSSWSSAIAAAMGLSATNRPIDLGIRTICFLLNLAFNALMWALFTAALTRGSSTTRVAIVNTSANFVLTALLGSVIFGEKLSPMWWVGAGGLVVGNVVIGRREEEEEEGLGGKRGAVRVGERYRDRREEGEISDGVEMGGREGRGDGDGEVDGKDGGENEGENEERRGGRSD